MMMANTGIIVIIRRNLYQAEHIWVEVSLRFLAKGWLK